MNLADLMRFLPQALLSGGAVVFAIWVKMPWPAVAALGIVAAELVSVSRQPLAHKWSSAIAWGCTPVVVAGVVAKGKAYLGDSCCAWLGFLNAAALLLTSYRFADVSIRKRWKILGMVWAFAAGLFWLWRCYLENLSGLFHLALLINIGLLILCHLLFRMPTLGIQTVNSLIFLLVGLPIADRFVRPVYRPDVEADPRKKYYSYENARKDPGGSETWQRAYQQRLGALWRHICIGHFPYDKGPWPLKPGGSGFLFGSKIVINSKGFRGKEIPEAKGNAYRIVALGESTTFGLTLNPEDKPWPELLEQIIRERLQPQRPVEVINAGICGFYLKINLDRMAKEILPLKPDMIISYHGYNGFFLIQQALPFSYVQAPPAYKPRPLKLLADAEYSLKILRYKYRAANVQFNPPAQSALMETEYARAYRELVKTAKTNSIRLVLANYSMAVNRQSDPAVIEFYRTTYPAIYWEMKAHSSIVQEVAQQSPEVCFVDTHPGLDGQHEKFIDLLHFDPQGEQQMAETFFAGIKKVLQEDLVRTNSAIAQAAVQ